MIDRPETIQRRVVAEADGDGYLVMLESGEVVHVDLRAAVESVAKRDARDVARKHPKAVVVTEIEYRGESR